MNSVELLDYQGRIVWLNPNHIVSMSEVEHQGVKLVLIETVTTSCFHIQGTVDKIRSAYK